MVKVCGTYRWKDGARFDPVYYRTEHMRITRELLLPLGLQRLESDETLSAAIDRYLTGLPHEAREALGYLCVYEPLSAEDLVAVAGESAVAAALETAAVQACDTRRYAGHPLFLERLAATPASVARERPRVM